MVFMHSDEEDALVLCPTEGATKENADAPA
jgi:hypothetical protein